LRMGMKGSGVRALQIKLNSLGFSVGQADGIFGGQTESGLKQFQKSAGIKIDGVYGPNTKRELEDYKPRKYPGLIKEGSRGENVKLIQRKVGVKADGIFGPNTENAVKKWQRANRLVADGLVGPATWKKMFN